MPRSRRWILLLLTALTLGAGLSQFADRNPQGAETPAAESAPALSGTSFTA